MERTAEIEKTFGNKVRVRVCGICIQEKSILLVKHLHIGRGDYLWAPPGGGLNYGERVEDCLIREIKEEVGLIVEVGDFMFINEFLEAPLHAIELFFKVKVVGGILRKGSDPELHMNDQMIADVRFCDDDFIKNEKPEHLHSALINAGEIEKFLSLAGYLS